MHDAKFSHSGDLFSIPYQRGNTRMTDVYIIAQTIRAIVSLSDNPLERLERLAAEHQHSIFRSPTSQLNSSNQELYFLSNSFCEAFRIVWVEYGGSLTKIPKLSNLIGNSDQGEPME